MTTLSSSLEMKAHSSALRIAYDKEDVYTVMRTSPQIQGSIYPFSAAPPLDHGHEIKDPAEIRCNAPGSAKTGFLLIPA